MSIPIKSRSSKHKAREYLLEKKFPNCLTSAPVRKNVPGAIRDVVCYDELQRLMGIGKKAISQNRPMTFGAVVSRVIRDINYAFENLHARIVVLCFDVQSDVPIAKGAEQATRDIAKGVVSSKESDGCDTWEVTATANLFWNQPLPEKWDEGMATRRDTFRPVVISRVCNELLYGNEGKKRWTIPEDGEVIIVGHCLKRADGSFNGPIHVIGPGKEIESGFLNQVSVGEAEMQMFWIPSILMQHAKAEFATRDNSYHATREELQKRPLSIELFSTDTDVLFLTLLWLWRVDKHIRPKWRPEVRWTFSWDPAKVAGSKCTALLTKLSYEIELALPEAPSPALLMVYFYLAAGSDYTEGYMNAPHNLFFSVLFDYWSSHFRCFFNETNECLDENDYAALIMIVLKNRRVSRDKIVECVPEIPFEYVLYARARQLMYIWKYMLMVGSDFALPRIPTKADGYAVIDESKPMSKQNVRRLLYLNPDEVESEDERKE